MIRLRIGASGVRHSRDDVNQAVADMMIALEAYAQSADADITSSAQKMTKLLWRMAIFERLKRRYDRRFQN